MRLSDLLGAEVRAADGSSLGTVHDVRLRQELGSGLSAEGAGSFWVDALVVGPGALGARLGYARRELGGPWPLDRLMARLARRSVVIDVRDVAERDGRVIRLRRAADRAS